jgi:hypothetical protein
VLEVELLSPIGEVTTIATGRGVRIRHRLRRVYGQGRWHKMKGVATIRLADGTICEAEIHWFEAHGIGRRDYKVKRVIS